MIRNLVQFVEQHFWCGPHGSHTASMPIGRCTTAFFSLKNPDVPSENISFSEHHDIQKSQEGDPDAYRRLIERHQGHVGKLLWRFTRNRSDHEELVQETFVQAYISLHTYKAEAPFEHWLARIATRCGYRFWKRQQKHQHQPLMENDWDELAHPVVDETEPSQAAELIHALLAKLKPRDRLVLTLRYLEECDVEQTAQRTGWSETMVKVQTHRAKQKLKKLLDKADISIEL